jgi:lipopolysaccharide/colanic/teichoic acid biosynthesis glycosyltransferase/glycosyltransferase involved in cell wall biosynthesis
VNVCFFNRSFYPDFGAVGQLLTELAGDLVQEYGCRVTVVTGPSLRARGGPASNGNAWKLFQRERHNGIAIFRAKGTTFGKERSFGRFANYLSYFFSACYAGLRVPRQDIVVSTTDPPIIGLAGLITARRSGAKFVFLCQDIFPEVATLLEDFHSPTVNRILQWVNRFLIRKADGVIAIGETMRDRLVNGKGADPAKTTIIHNWADCSVIEPGPKENPLSLSNGLSRPFVIMHSGNVGLSQNLETLIEAAERLRKHPDIVFVVVGEGVKRSSLEAMVQFKELGNVRFFPYQPKERLSESFATADVFFISLKRGLAGYIVPSKLYGILAAGRPYVAAVEPDCEVAAITKQYDCGLLAEPGDAQDLADKILTLHRDRALAERLGQNGRHGSFHFDRRNQIRAYFELFRKLAVRGRRIPFFKRCFDVFLSGTGLIFSSPLWLLIALLIKLEDGGPIFFAQERGGQGGRRFKSWKFRSMVPDAERKFGFVQALEKDPRVTRVGRILRATAMDELPQLWNIFKGDMSFVGPRSLPIREIEINGSGDCIALEEIPGHARRHGVRPGLTGVAQIYAPRDIPRRQKFRYDLLYIEKQSFCLDLRLIALSFWITFRGKWESRGRKI